MREAIWTAAVKDAESQLNLDPVQIRSRKSASGKHHQAMTPDALDRREIVDRNHRATQIESDAGPKYQDHQERYNLDVEYRLQCEARNIWGDLEAQLAAGVPISYVNKRLLNRQGYSSSGYPEHTGGSKRKR